MNVEKIIKNRLKEFERLGNSKQTLFDFYPFLNLKIRATIKSELAFCISTANSSAISGLYFQKQLEKFDFNRIEVEKIETLLKQAGVRFYSKKAIYISKALLNFEIVERALNIEDKKARDILVSSIKGLGYKEASHFLRNVGRKNIAIIDRHVLRWMRERGLIDNIPKNLNKKNYLQLERILSKLSDEIGMNLAKLDLYMWYEKTKKVLK
ncbi:MAG: N-glycosylase/DNA lyase [Archaeoglobaceae archaeon]|nr:N-glycosylase/DNA lyase [Archaeoglobaceae archaeon]